MDRAERLSMEWRLLAKECRADPRLLASPLTITRLTPTFIFAWTCPFYRRLPHGGEGSRKRDVHRAGCAAGHGNHRIFPHCAQHTGRIWAEGTPSQASAAGSLDLFTNFFEYKRLYPNVLARAGNSIGRAEPEYRASALARFARARSVILHRRRDPLQEAYEKFAARPERNSPHNQHPNFKWISSRGNPICAGGCRGIRHPQFRQRPELGRLQSAGQQSTEYAWCAGAYRSRGYPRSCGRLRCLLAD